MRSSVCFHVGSIWVCNMVYHDIGFIWSDMVENFQNGTFVHGCVVGE